MRKCKYCGMYNGEHLSWCSQKSKSRLVSDDPPDYSSPSFGNVDLFSTDVAQDYSSTPDPSPSPDTSSFDPGGGDSGGGGASGDW